MTPITCDTVRAQLHEFHDGELDVARQISVEAHLRVCPACARERAELADIGRALRAVAARAPIDPEAVARRVLPQLQVERQLAWPRRFERMFEDLHLVWAGVGATAATLICVAAVVGLLRAGAREQPASMAAVIGAMASPGSNLNPVRLDLRRMLLPRSDPNALVAQPLLNGDDLVFALSAIVTTDGRVVGLELLEDAGRAPVNDRAISDLLDAASQARFEPARAGGAAVAVNMVWLLAQTRVVGKATTLIPPPTPAAAPQPVSQRRTGLPPAVA